MQCLDSWAVLSWLDGDQPATEYVEKSIRKNQPVISWVNGCEVYYRIMRTHGEPTANQVIDQLKKQMIFDLPSAKTMIHVAQLKANHPIALADCFAIVTAANYDAALLTSDPEIINAQQLPCKVVDLR